MKHQDRFRARQRPLVYIFRTGWLLVVCLVGTVACLQDGNDGVALQTPSSTPRIARDVRASVTPDRPRTPTPHPPTPTFVPTDPQPAPAPTDLPTPVAAPPSQGQVVYTGAEGVNLRSEPNQQIIAALLKDSRIMIRGTYRDEDGFRWWPVAVEPGWIAERSSDPAQAGWIVPVAIDDDQIEAGDLVRVVYPGTEGLNLRRTPGADGEKLATFLQGSLLTVTGTPQQINGVNWWPVEVAQGWLSEGSTDPAQPRWIAFQP